MLQCKKVERRPFFLLRDAVHIFIIYYHYVCLKYNINHVNVQSTVWLHADDLTYMSLVARNGRYSLPSTSLLLSFVESNKDDKRTRKDIDHGTFSHNHPWAQAFMFRPFIVYYMLFWFCCILYTWSLYMVLLHVSHKNKNVNKKKTKSVHDQRT